MYTPKQSKRYHPKVSIPIRLDDQCLNATFLMLSKVSKKIATSRNIHEKKSVREFLSSNVPVYFQKRILEKAVERLAGAQTTLLLLDLFNPKDVAQDSVDLLGSFRREFGCYVEDDKLIYVSGEGPPQFSLKLPQLDQLYTILLWSNPSKLTNLSLSVALDAMKKSNLPNLLARAHSLTRLTILNDMENHTLRIIGIFCPKLVFLDVSNSRGVNDEGMRCLLIKRHRESKGLNPDFVETNPCAQTLCTVLLSGTKVSWNGCNLACKLMKFGFYTATADFIIKILRFNPQMIRCQEIPLDQQILSPDVCSCLSVKAKEEIFSSAHSTLLARQLRNAVMDVYYTDSPNDSSLDPAQSYVFIRDSIDNFKIHLCLKMETTEVTVLVLPWYTWTWTPESYVDLDTIGFHFPNLKSLKGRVRGRWTRWNQQLLPCLESAHVWSRDSTTALSMLQNIPFLKYLELNTGRPTDPAVNLNLTDASLESALSSNETLAKNLEHFTIRPSKLTRNALSTLINKCPSLKRIGDLESWNIVSSEIREFNSHLDSTGSQCVLTIMNFPPEQDNKYQWTI